MTDKQAALRKNFGLAFGYRRRIVDQFDSYQVGFGLRRLSHWKGRYTFGTSIHDSEHAGIDNYFLNRVLAVYPSGGGSV
jgi:hypothetical protein